MPEANADKNAQPYSTATPASFPTESVRDLDERLSEDEQNKVTGGEQVSLNFGSKDKKLG